MSLHVLAADLARKGRGPDSVLVHMTPGEVAGLEALARKHYGQGLTVNPETGMPEAGILGKLLPAIAGIGMSMMGVPPLWAAGIVGGGTALATGSLSKGLMAGLGAYGGAGIGEGLAGMGTAAAASAAASAAPAAGTAAAQMAPAMVSNAAPALADTASGAMSGMDMAADAASFTNPSSLYAMNGMDAGGGFSPSGLTAGPTPQAAALQANPAMVDPSYAARNGMDVDSDIFAQKAAIANSMSGYDKVMAGAKSAFEPGGFDRFAANMGGTKGMLTKGAMAFGPALMGGAQQPGSTKKFEDPNDDAQIRPYNYDPRVPGGMGYTALTPYPAKEAKTRFSTGGTIRDALERVSQAARSGGGGGGIGGGLTANPGLSGIAGVLGGAPVQAQVGAGNAMMLGSPPAKDPLTKNFEDTYAMINQGFASAGRPQIDTPVPYLGPSSRIAQGYAALGQPTMAGGMVYDPNTQTFNKPGADAGAGGAGAGPTNPMPGAPGYNPGAVMEPVYLGGPMQVTDYSALYPGQNYFGMAEGGIARLVQGPGDGVSDSIPATINNTGPARIASGEYIVPARVVSELGNGSTDAGARRLDQMVQRVQQMRTKTAGKKSRVAVDSGAYKAMPA